MGYVKYYTNSKGEKLLIEEMNTEHLINALAKLHREIYNSKNNDEWCDKQLVIVSIDKELLKRENAYWKEKFEVETNE